MSYVASINIAPPLWITAIGLTENDICFQWLMYGCWCVSPYVCVRLWLCLKLQFTFKRLLISLCSTMSACCYGRAQNTTHLLRVNNSVGYALKEVRLSLFLPWRRSFFRYDVQYCYKDHFSLNLLLLQQTRAPTAKGGNWTSHFSAFDLKKLFTLNSIRWIFNLRSNFLFTFISGIRQILPSHYSRAVMVNIFKQRSCIPHLVFLHFYSTRYNFSICCALSYCLLKWSCTRMRVVGPMWRDSLWTFNIVDVRMIQVLFVRLRWFMGSTPGSCISFYACRVTLDICLTLSQIWFLVPHVPCWFRFDCLFASFSFHVGR